MSHQAQSEILNKFRGKEINIPDLCALYPAWPVGLNVNYEKLKLFLYGYLIKFAKNDVTMSKFLKADFALFASCWWPNAGFEELKTCACLAIWLFLWDDEIDQTSGRLAEDFEKAEEYREDTKVFLAHSLGLIDSLPKKEYHLLISSFSIVGDFLRQKFSREQRELFHDEMLFFLEAAKEEQAVRLRDEIPSIEEYWRTRLGTSAVGVCNVIIDLVESIQLSSSTMDLPAFTTLWIEANVIVSITNDILSLRKELAQHSIYSLIPLSTASISPQEAVDAAVLDLKASIKRFDEAAKTVTGRTTIVNRPVVEKWINGLRMSCTGNNTWSLRTGRYGIAGCRSDTSGYSLVVSFA